MRRAQSRHELDPLRQPERAAVPRSVDDGARPRRAGAGDLQQFPEYRDYFRIPAIKAGRRILRSQNTLLERYPGTTGMKTGFICNSGFNMVVSATRDGRTLIVVVLGADAGGAGRACREASQRRVLRRLPSASRRSSSPVSIPTPPPARLVNLHD